MQTIIGMIPNKYLIPAALLASANKRLIIPTAKKVATGVSTSLGILTEEQAKNQEKLFDKMMFPITSIIDNLESQIIEILGGTGFTETLSSWINGKKKHSPTEIIEKEDQAVKNEFVSAIGQNVGPQKNEVSTQEFKKQIYAPGKIKAKESLTQKSNISATNIDMNLFNAMEHENAHERTMNPNPIPSLSGMPSQSLGQIAKRMYTKDGSVLIPKTKF